MASLINPYEAILFFWRIVVSLFFREIRPRGAWHIPRTGPVIFVAAPHHNQFLDPVLLASETWKETRREIGFLIAASSMKRAVIGWCAKKMSAIPVARAADSSKPGSGLVALHPDDSRRVIGSGTKFTAELGPKSQILLPKAASSAVAEVLEVVSDTEVRIKTEFSVGDGTKGTKRVKEKCREAKEDGKDGLTWKILPHVDQRDVYEHVYNRLKEGGCIGIFPEGGSHDRTDLLPLKAGVTIMALGAMSANPSLRVRIVPVGLSYFHPHRFRSRAVIEFGRAFEVPQELVQMFDQGGDSKRSACSQLLDLIYDGLKTVTVRAPDYDTLMLIQASRRLYKTPGQHLTLSQVVELNKRFIEGYLRFQNEPRIQALQKRVSRYNRLLRDVGLRDHQVEQSTRVGWKAAVLLTYRTGLLIVWSILSLPGVILNAPIFITASLISQRKAKEALAASTVKLAGRDVLATWKVLVSLGLAPVLYSIYAVIATVIAHKCNVSLKWQVLMPFMVMSALPIIGYSALKFGEAGMDVLKSLPPLILSLLPGQQRTLNKLKKMRDSISTELSDVINEFGPQIYDDFDARRIVHPSAAVPPSSDAALGLWRRKSGTGAVDAQGNLLIHPMTWLDERIFGWSHSAKRGKSAWSGSRSTDVSRAGSPHESDTEDTEPSSDGRGDWDDVLGMLHSYENNDHLRSNGGFGKAGHRATYKDLRKLDSGNNGLSPESRGRSGSSTFLAPVYHRQPVSTPTSPSSPTDTRRQNGSQPSPLFMAPDDYASRDDENTTSPRRRRKSSLSDGVSVELIHKELGEHDAFAELTNDLNRQNTERKHVKEE